MDQPYSRIADALLDRQYWSPDDPQKTPYDDTGWTFGELFGVQVTRVTDIKVLDVPMDRVTGIRAPGGVKGQGTVFAINNSAEPALATLRYKRSEEHTSELQSRLHLVCRLLLEKKKKT